jgi:hypothetical protein
MPNCFYWRENHSLFAAIQVFLKLDVLRLSFRDQPFGSANHRISMRWWWNDGTSTFQALNQSRYQSCWVYRYFTLKHQVCVLYLLFSVWRLESLQLLRSQPCGDTWSILWCLHTISVKLMPSDIGCKNDGETLPFSHQTMASSKTHETALNENTTGWPDMDALVLPRLMWETSLGRDDVHKWS